MNLLAQYPFPGNIRELESMIFDAVSTHKKGILSLEKFRMAIGKSAFPSRGTRGQTEEGLDHAEFKLIIGNVFPRTKTIETELIREAMKRTKGNQSIAARMLGISRPTLSNRLKEMKNSEN